MAEKLAINGGVPVRDKDHKIFYGKQWIDEADVKAVTDVLVSPYLTCGPKIDELEKRLSEVTGAPYVTLVSNGTAALHIACMAIGIKEGDEVIVSSITFAASANCVLYCGGTPVFADVDEKTYNIDVEDVKRKITPKTKAVIAVDFTGQATNLKAIREICDEHNLYFIEDAAHSIGTVYDGKKVGSIADITTFSFHPVKTVTAGEGGAVATIHEDLHKKIHLLRSHGITRDMSEMRNPSDARWYNEQVMLGYNYRMTDFQAALLLSQLDKLSMFIKRRKEIRAMYDEAFSKCEGIILQECIPESDTAWHLYIIRLDKNIIKASRREFFDALYEEGTCPQVHYLPVYMHSYYESLGYKKGLCPVAESTYESIMSIPFYPALTDEEVKDVIKAVCKVAENYR